MSKTRKRRKEKGLDSGAGIGFTSGFKEYKACHTGSVEVFTDPVSGIKFKGGGAHRGLIIRDETIITAATDPRPVIVEGIDPGTLSRWTNPIIKLDWNDGGAFQLGKEFWFDLLAKLRADKKDVLCMCQGGHGRTGTMLAIFAALTGSAQEADPVEFVRANYCDDAVETEVQIDYIERITGAKITAKASDVPVSSGGFHSLGNWKNWFDKGHERACALHSEFGYVSSCDACRKLNRNDKLAGWGEV